MRPIMCSGDRAIPADVNDYFPIRLPPRLELRNNTTISLCYDSAFGRNPWAPYRVLPPGIHWTSLETIGGRFATNERRMELFQGFAAVLEALKNAGCRRVYLNGSFTTDKPLPEDYDGCWDPEGVDVRKLDPVLLDFGNLRAAQKQKYRGEMFVAVLPNSPNDTFLEFFQIDKYTGEQKGILGIRAAEREDRT